LKSRPAVPLGFHENLKAVLPHGTWVRLAAQVSDEMHNLALTLSACNAAGDSGTSERVTQALRSLASNFGALGVVNNLQPAQKLAGRCQANSLLAAIRAWKSANS
jgi:hypothetical protein